MKRGGSSPATLGGATMRGTSPRATPLGAAARIALAARCRVGGGEMDWSELVAWRRDLHRHAEPGWCEFRTSALVAARLEEWGYQVQTGAAIVAPEARMGVPSDAVLEREYRRALEWGSPEARLAPMRGGLTGVVGTLDSGRPGPTLGIRFDLDANDGLAEPDDPAHRPAREGFRSIHPSAQ